MYLSEQEWRAKDWKARMEAAGVRRPSLVRILASAGGFALAACYVNAQDAVTAAVYAGVGGFLLGGEVRDLIRWLVWRRP